MALFYCKLCFNFWYWRLQFMQLGKGALNPKLIGIKNHSIRQCFLPHNRKMFTWRSEIGDSREEFFFISFSQWNPERFQCLHSDVFIFPHFFLLFDDLFVCTVHPFCHSDFKSFPWWHYWLNKRAISRLDFLGWAHWRQKHYSTTELGVDNLIRTNCRSRIVQFFFFVLIYTSL